MLITVRGRVEADPMRIPTPARTSNSPSDAFASLLDRASGPEPIDDAVAEPAPGAAADPAEPAPEVPPEAVEARTEEPAATPADAQPAAANAAATVAGVSAAATIHRTEEPAKDMGGQGGEAPRSTTRPDEALLIAALQHGARANATPALPTGGGPSPVATTGAPVEPPPRGVDATGARTASPLRTPALAAGYRANAVVSTELVDQARDSVFKQILLKLTGDGGEMRVLLQPPELGELDLRVVVERGNQLSLWLGAERPELAAMLQKNLDELRHALQASGLEITDAQVGTRDQGRGERRDRGAHSSDARDESFDAKPARRSGGWVTAEGLDFWA